MEAKKIVTHAHASQGLAYFGSTYHAKTFARFLALQDHVTKAIIVKFGVLKTASQQ